LHVFLFLSTRNNCVSQREYLPFALTVPLFHSSHPSRPSSSPFFLGPVVVFPFSVDRVSSVSNWALAATYNMETVSYNKPGYICDTHAIFCIQITSMEKTCAVCSYKLVHFMKSSVRLRISVWFPHPGARRHPGSEYILIC
jgi:hypothetical protein